MTPFLSSRLRTIVAASAFAAMPLSSLFAQGDIESDWQPNTTLFFEELLPSREAQDEAETLTDIGRLFDHPLLTNQFKDEDIDRFFDELDELPQDLPVFALETGGCDLKDFKFPEKGICIIGSEELGVSPQALERATYGRVSIPMKGLKASLNVGVAFGILMQAWVDALNTLR